MKVAIIGGGAAGFFAALTCAEYHPKAEIYILEKTHKLLSKVKISGGGRCNVTHHVDSLTDIVKGYPRGGKALKKVLADWMPRQTVEWFGARGVPIHAEEDGRMFPVSNDSQTIIDCFLREAKKFGINIITQADVVMIKTHTQSTWLLSSSKGVDFVADKVIITTGGSPKASGLAWLEALGHEIIAPVPSLFTINLAAHHPITKLAGVSVPCARVRMAGSKLSQEGAMLITHWGLSGPAVLRLSAWGARELAEKHYDCDIRIHWLPTLSQDILSWLAVQMSSQGSKQVSQPIGGLPRRLWDYLVQKARLNPERRWRDLNAAEQNRLIETLTNDDYQMQGKTTFKDEFVTCGGVSLASIDMATMQSRVCAGIYFAGEVLDIDGITGGFNFQAAWATARRAGRLLQ